MLTVSFELLTSHGLRTRDEATTLLSTTKAIKALSHVPLRARVEERQFISCLETLGTSNDGERGSVENL